jgi:hypothetical protein
MEVGDEDRNFLSSDDAEANAPQSKDLVSYAREDWNQISPFCLHHHSSSSTSWRKLLPHRLCQSSTCAILGSI